MKVTITAYAYMGLDYKRSADGTPAYLDGKVWTPELWKCRVSDEDDRVFIGTQDVTVEVPDDFDPTAQQIAAIEREKATAAELFRKTIASCNERLSKLQALEAA
jgi:hypothetical protein